jgi:hypothetical protein
VTSFSEGLERVGALLHGDADVWSKGEFGRVARRILPVAVVAGLFYGAAMGSYGQRGLQVLYSALKVPVLLGASTALCLPGLAAFLGAIGLGRHLGRILRGIVLSQATVMISLAALAPVIALVYVSTADYAVAKAFNGLMFALASFAGQWTLARHFRPILALEPRCRIGLVLWLLLYVFVGVQLAWVLRPFIGHPDMPVRFLREDAWGNAYVQIVSMLREVVD